MDEFSPESHTSFYKKVDPQLNVFSSLINLVLSPTVKHVGFTYLYTSTLVKNTVLQLFKVNLSVSSGMFNKLGNFLFFLLQDSQDSDDESKCFGKNSTFTQ